MRPYFEFSYDNSYSDVIDRQLKKNAPQRALDSYAGLHKRRNLRSVIHS